MKFHALAAAAAVVALAAPAHSATVVLTGFKFPPATNATVSSPSYSGPAGQMVGTLDSNSFETYCAELTQSVSFGVPMTGYSLVSGATAWGAQKAADMSSLMSAVAAFGLPFDSSSSAVIQAMVWEIIYETASTYDLSSGSFVASSTDAGTAAQMGSVNWAIALSVPKTVNAHSLQHKSQQDLIALTPAIPEPETYALMLAGLAAVGFMTKRRAAKA